MKYKLFYGNIYYASGGWCDFKGNFDSEKEAREYLEKTETDECLMWAHIVFEDKIIRYATVDSWTWDWRDEE